MTEAASVECILSPLKVNDLITILNVTPYGDRPTMACFWAKIAIPQWATLAGLNPQTLRRWIARETPLTYDGATKLAAVFGVPANVLFEGYGEVSNGDV